jgi:hypothetical protein
MASKSKRPMPETPEHAQAAALAFHELNHNSADNSERLAASAPRPYYKSDTVDATINNDLAPSTAMDI